MPIFNDTSVDRSEEHQVEEGQARNKRETERRQQRESMKTFEAKLTEKTAHDVSSKETALRQAHDQKQAKEEKQSLLEKILGVAKEKTGETEQTKVQGAQRQQEKAFEEKRGRKTVDTDFEDKRTEEKKTTQKSESKKGEVSEEGYKRVAEKQDQGGASGGGAEQGDGSSQQGTSFGLGAQTQDQSQRDLKKGISRQPFDAQLKTVGKVKFSFKGGFQKDARTFQKKDLDEVVTAVQHGLNEQGEEEFSVQLSDHYYDGLKVAATRTAEGVVVKFICSNADVRSTFLKCRPQLYLQLKAKGISVVRIDIV